MYGLQINTVVVANVCMRGNFVYVCMSVRLHQGRTAFAD